MGRDIIKAGSKRQLHHPVTKAAQQSNGVPRAVRAGQYDIGAARQDLFRHAVVEVEAAGLFRHRRGCRIGGKKTQ